jgi:hypothetical protein
MDVELVDVAVGADEVDVLAAVAAPVAVQARPRLSDSKLNATESPKLFATEKKSHGIIVLLLE